jgi:hypothetical protein
MLEIKLSKNGGSSSEEEEDFMEVIMIRYVVFRQFD